MKKLKQSSLAHLVTKENKLPVTKIEAAVRQLETAITLWFHDSDPISIATLAHAGYQIIYDLNKQRGGALMMLDGHMFKEEYKEDVILLMRSTPNFLKHADLDPDAVHFLCPDSTRWVILEATQVYLSWRIDSRPLFWLFMNWLLIEEPKVFAKQALDAFQMPHQERDRYLRVGKKAFFYEMLPALVSSAATATCNR